MLKLLSIPWVKGLILICLVIAAIHIVSALTVDRVLAYTEITAVSSKIDSAHSGYRIAFLTDIHGYPAKKMQEMVNTLNEKGVDLVLFGGDFPSGKRLASVLEMLAQIDAPDGFYSAPGNHDKADNLRSALAAHDMTLLENGGVQIFDGLYIAGTEDLWKGTPDIPAATQAAGEDDFVLLLAHNPDTTMEHDCAGIDLALCGHVHGGEITLFGVYGPAIIKVSKYGQKFRSGWAQSAADTPVYVSRGIGSHAFRVFSQPQVILVTLQAEDSAAAE